MFNIKHSKLSQTEISNELVGEVLTRNDDIDYVTSSIQSKCEKSKSIPLELTDN